MYTRAFVKNLIVPSITVGVVRAEGKEDECDNTRKLVRPRDLALYVDPPKCVTCSNVNENEDGFLLTTIRCARQELQSVLEQAKIIQAEASSMLDNIKKETSDAVSYLQQEENLLPRMGAIGIGAFAGYLLALRKGIIKKVLYSAAGAGAIAAVAYPNEAREISEEVMCELKKYAVIGYHFVNGADVDWKKLKEATRPPCFGKDGKRGGEPDRSDPSANNNGAGTAARNAPMTTPGGDEPSVAANADVDWKKLNEELRCLEKSGIAGGPQGKVGKMTAADPRSLEDPDQTQSDDDSKALTQTKPCDTTEAPTGDHEPRASSQSVTKASSSPTERGNAEDSFEPCKDVPLPQERPKNNASVRHYKSYLEQCKVRPRSACTKRQRSGRDEAGTVDPGKRGNPEKQRSGDVEQSSMPSAPIRDAEDLCDMEDSSDNGQKSTHVNTLPDSYRTQLEADGSRPRTAGTKQSLEPVGPPSFSDASETGILPDQNVTQPRGSDPCGQISGVTSGYGSQQWPPKRPCTPARSQGQQRPRSAGQCGSQSACQMPGCSFKDRAGSPEQKNGNVSARRPSTGEPRGRRADTRDSRPPSSGGARCQGRGLSQQRPPSAQSGYTSPALSAGEAPQIECGSPSANGNLNGQRPDENTV